MIIPEFAYLRNTVKVKLFAHLIIGEFSRFIILQRLVKVDSALGVGEKIGITS